MAETAASMEKRHKAEMRELEGKVRALMKTAKKSNRALIEAEAIRMGYDLKARHTEEYDLLPADGEQVDHNAVEENELEEEKQALKHQSAAETDPEIGAREVQDSVMAKKAKAQKKKDKKLSKDAERQQVKEDINSSAGPSLREIELERINELLFKDDLIVKVVASDGHCLYRAIADQLNTLWLHDSETRTTGGDGLNSVKHDFASLRALAATYLRTHSEEFAPFLGMESSDSEYSTYCDRVESVPGAEWGGQVEIKALCSCLDRAVMVFSADAPVLLMGEPSDASRLPLKVAYHRHFYALGEHYNSVAPIIKPCTCCASTGKTE